MFAVNGGKPILSKSKKEIVGLPGLFDADFLAELTEEDRFLGSMKRAIINKDVTSFNKLGDYMALFWPKAAVVNNCVIIDNKLAIPEASRQAVLARLHRSHPGQEAMMSASEYIWWPFLNRQIVDTCEKCRECTLYAQKLERNLLTPDQNVSQDYSRDRAKVVPRGSNSPQIAPRFNPMFSLQGNVAEKEPYKALADLAWAANKWTQNKRNLPPDGGKRVLKELSSRHSDLAHSLKKGLSRKTLCFAEDRSVDRPPGAQDSVRRLPTLQPVDKRRCPSPVQNNNSKHIR